MEDQKRARPEPVPLSSLIFGYGPMGPFVVAAVLVWMLAEQWSQIAIELDAIWGGMILIFVAGVRRGYGFRAPEASTTQELGTMLVYFTLGGFSLIMACVGQNLLALVGLIVGFMLVSIFDRRAALTGDAPAHFARLRRPQMTIAVLSLALALAYLVTHPNIPPAGF